MAANKCWWEVFKIGLPRAMVWVGCSQFGCQEEKRQGGGYYLGFHANSDILSMFIELGIPINLGHKLTNFVAYISICFYK